MIGGLLDGIDQTWGGPLRLPAKKISSRFGFHAVSVSERLLMPVRPDWSNDAGLPESYVWDPVEMLTWAAAAMTFMHTWTSPKKARMLMPICNGRLPLCAIYSINWKPRRCSRVKTMRAMPS